MCYQFPLLAVMVLPAVTSSSGQGQDKLNYCTTTSQTNKQAIKHTHKQTNTNKHTFKLSIVPNTITTSPSLIIHHDSSIMTLSQENNATVIWANLISFQQAMMLCQPSCSRMCMVMTLISGTGMLNLDTGMNGPMKLRPRMAREACGAHETWKAKNGKTQLNQ